MAEKQRLPLVLVADDDDETRALVTSWLRDSGYDVVAARDRDEALEVATEQQPDLLLLDVTRAGEDGHDVCRAIQAASAVPPPVIFLTEQATVTAGVPGLAAAAADYIVKPLERTELVARVRQALRVKAVSDRLAPRATRDGLTGLLNRAEVDHQADAAVKLAERHARPLSCLMIDLDGFEEVNDGLGQRDGDEVLREVARRILGACRASDIVGRYGGEEFVVLLPETLAADAMTTGDKIRRVLSERPIVVHGRGVELTASVGAAVWNVTMGAAALIEAADDGLARAKELGPNHTELDR